MPTKYSQDFQRRLNLWRQHSIGVRVCVSPSPTVYHKSVEARYVHRSLHNTRLPSSLVLNIYLSSDFLSSCLRCHLPIFMFQYSCKYYASNKISDAEDIPWKIALICLQRHNLFQQNAYPSLLIGERDSNLAAL